MRPRCPPRSLPCSFSCDSIHPKDRSCSSRRGYLSLARGQLEGSENHIRISLSAFLYIHTEMHICIAHFYVQINLYMYLSICVCISSGPSVRLEVPETELSRNLIANLLAYAPWALQQLKAGSSRLNFYKLGLESQTPTARCPAQTLKPTFEEEAIGLVLSNLFEGNRQIPNTLDSNNKSSFDKGPEPACLFLFKGTQQGQARKQRKDRSQKGPSCRKGCNRGPTV